IGAVKKSMVITNYVDLPLEIRFYTNPNDVYRSFHVTLGAYVGVLFDSGTKIKHAQSGENKILKDKQSFDLNPLRYGAGIRIGVGGFNIYGRYNLSPLFRPGFGPGGEDFNALTLGFSVIGF
ncbi:MAG TPA: outer membrane beta-barrel protein, partial [Cyclobacteriaceae bacterium]|nr:outer membrane beta-barrel protein [Cyclobacteriaceae bacterium]